MITSAATGSTRDRLAAAALRLFAEKGFAQTTVGEIESAAGLKPRRGALYRHFESKEALLDAAAELHLSRLQDGLAAAASLSDDPTAEELETWARWFLAEMDEQRDLFRVLEHNGDRLPSLRTTLRERAIDAGHQLIADLIRRKRGDDVDAAALAVMVVGPLANHRRTEWTFGAPPAGVTEDRLVTTWRQTMQAAFTTPPSLSPGS